MNQVGTTHTFTDIVSQDSNPPPTVLAYWGLVFLQMASPFFKSTRRFAFTAPEMGASPARNGAGHFITQYKDDHT